MFALRHKFTGTFMYQTCETDGFGYNEVIVLVEEQHVKNYQYCGTTVYVQPHADMIEHLLSIYEKNKHSHVEYQGTFSEPVMNVPLEEYEIVELEIVIK